MSSPDHTTTAKDYTTGVGAKNDIRYQHFSHTGEDAIAIRAHRVSIKDQVPHVMFCGGFHSSMNGNKALAVMEWCQQENWHCTLFDYRGHGQSGGDPANLTLQDWLADTLAVLDESDVPTVLIGSSMGAWLATLCALQRPSTVSGLLLLAAAPDFLQELIEPSLGPSEIWDLQQGQAIKLPTRYDEPYPITSALIDSGKALSLLDQRISDVLECPVHLIHGTADEDVPYKLSIRLMECTGGDDARLTLLKGADHRLSDPHELNVIKESLYRLIQATAD